MEKTVRLFLASLFSLLPLSLLFAPSALANETQYHLIQTLTGQNIPPSSNSGAWCNDIAYYDHFNGRVYLADDNNKQIDVIDSKSNVKKLLAPITSSDFTGIGNCDSFDYSQQGPNGIVADSKGRLWVGNGNSTVEVFDTKTGAKLATISTHGSLRADELAYDEKDNILIATNPEEASGPFYSLIDGNSYSVINHLKYTVPGAEALEQPAWNPVDDQFYMSVPSVGAINNSPALPGGEVAVINPLHTSNPTNTTQPFVKALSIGNCSPNGLALDILSQKAALGCSNDAEVLSLKTGHIDTFSQINGVDEVWFNAGDRRWYFSSYVQQSIGVVSAPANAYLTSIPVNDPDFHSAAVDSENNTIYAPKSGAGILVFHATE